MAAPISLSLPQYVDANGTPYNGAVLKAYAAGTTTNILMYTDTGAGTSFTDIALNASGYPEYSGSMVIPHVSENYKLALYADQAAADANTPAIWAIDGLIPLTISGTFVTNDAVSNASTNVLSITHTTTGTPVNGIGVGQSFSVETSNGNTELGMVLETVATDVTIGSEDFDFVIKLMTAGAAAAEVFRVTSLGGLTSTGRLTGSDLDLTGANPEILGGDTDGVLITSANTTALGSITKQYGDTHATKAGDFELLDDAGVVYHYDASGALHDFTGAVTASGLLTATAGITSGGDILSDTDSTDSIGSTGVRWLKGWFDTLQAGTLVAGAGSITDTSGAISFGDENLTTTGVITGATVEATGDTSAGDAAAMGYTAANGLELTGQGSTNDVTLLNDLNNIVMRIPTGTTETHFNGSIQASVNLAGDYAHYISNGSAATDAEINFYVGNVAATASASVGLGAGGTGLTTAGGFIQDSGWIAAGTALSGGLSLMARGASSDVRVYAGSHTNLVATFDSAGDTTFAGSIITASAGNSNFRAGVNAGNSILSGGDFNVVVGDEAGAAITTGDNNAVIGYGAGSLITTGGNNTALGYGALDAISTDSNNTAVGYDALGATTAGANTAIGSGAGGSNITGHTSVFIGINAGNSTVLQTAGIGNVLVGPYTHGANATANDQHAFGYNLAAEAGYTTLGDSGNDIRAAFGNITWATVSDERFKKDIEDSKAGLSFINTLRPRTFKYRTLGELPETFRSYEAGSTKVFKNSYTNHGFIAQEVKEAIDADSSIKDGFRLWDDREDGSQEVAEAALIPVLVKAIQELSAEVEELKAKLAVK